LDFYGVTWQYEPVEFVLERNRRGEPAAAFRPDFYLPAYDLFIEVTTLNQKLVTKKNGKVRRLLELYPEVNIKVLYQRDYFALLVKFGLEGPSQLGDVSVEGGDRSPLPFEVEPGRSAPAGPAGARTDGPQLSTRRPEFRWPSEWPAQRPKAG
jgi:hypothetical protein